MKGWLRLELEEGLHERLAVAATREGLTITSYVRRAIVVALRGERLVEERGRYKMALEAIAVSRATDAERLRALARLGLGR